jgi:hypothetical protein
MRLAPFCLFVIALVATSCGGSQHASSTAYSNARYLADGKSQHTPGERVVQYAATLELKVKEADSTNVQLRAIAEKHQGYVVSLADGRSVIRVKQPELAAAVDEVAALGKLRSKAFKGEDVTEQYVDLNARLENARRARERYLQLLQQAENVQAALAVEKELERVNGDIESFEGKLNKLTHLADMATITVQLQEKDKLGPLGYVFVGLWKGVRWLFVRGE